jgi:hypothetical protein
LASFSESNLKDPVNDWKLTNRLTIASFAVSCADLSAEDLAGIIQVEAGVLKLGVCISRSGWITGVCVVDGLSDDIWLLFNSPDRFDWWFLAGIVAVEGFASIEGVVYVAGFASVGIFASIEGVVYVERFASVGIFVSIEDVVYVEGDVYVEDIEYTRDIGKEEGVV